MLVSELTGSPEVDPDEAPELTVDMLDRAEVFDGDRFVRRGRGRPLLDAPKEKVNVRLDAAALERLRSSGPGWQTRVNDGLAVLTGVDRRLWDWIEQRVADDERMVETILRDVELMQSGTMRHLVDGEDATGKFLARSKDDVLTLGESVRVMRETQQTLLTWASAKP